MKISCAWCKKTYAKASKGVEWRLRGRHFCSAKCFKLFAGPKKYFFKTKSHRPHKKDLEEEINDIYVSNMMERFFP